MAGQILGDRYQVERQLNKQAGRWTLLGRDLTSQQWVVLKLLFVDDQLIPSDLKQFDREMHALQALSHPCIPQYLGYFEHELPMGKAIVLVQDYVPGNSLQDLLQMGRTFTEPEAKQLATVLLKVLAYLHRQTPPMIHRDLKPGNIVLADRRPHLVDFGSVKMMIGAERSAFSIVGTDGYMPPEQFSGRAVMASDLYGLGSTIVHLVTGQLPSTLPRKQGQLQLQEVIDLSPAFTDWLQWMTEMSLDRRLQTAEEALLVLNTGQVRGML
ncbi:serine/threonine-protein kinase [Alkalinema sp. FACHB-956]|uniref:serine/threonine protein kinase n=1 Tax=Alkalinema sp. FACHB-956 TaxID=2692768 RepID=UPI001682285A|nr:serine/threonine-protein kinase [Alkalinema sp. FACHB-956]MBD2328892.1 serine/threonine protein kinase [Alkalinema sp. FACHB-956]